MTVSISLYDVPQAPKELRRLHGLQIKTTSLGPDPDIQCGNSLQGGWASRPLKGVDPLLMEVALEFTGFFILGPGFYRTSHRNLCLTGINDKENHSLGDSRRVFLFWGLGTTTSDEGESNWLLIDHEADRNAEQPAQRTLSRDLPTVPW